VALVLPWEGVSPRIHAEAFLAPTATVIGDVAIGETSSIWFGTVVRGDVNRIRIGIRTNIQDLTMCHVTSARHDLVIGDDVTVGHRVILHGCHIGNRVTIGMGSVVLDGVEIGEESIVAAGAVCLERTKFPPRSFIVGFPAARKGDVAPEKLGQFVRDAEHYVKISQRYLAQFPEWKAR
jgi:carbonic anhydrase/acetyltransferase-like protein (isoleucine patch superfamily)